MSAATYAPPLQGIGTPTRPGLVLLTRVEMRKMVDTRSGKWLVGIIAGLSVVAVVILLFAGDGDFRTFRAFFEASLYPVAVLLPVLGILTVTTEWSQRTALTTFTLVPQRWRIAVAKLLAASGCALVSMGTSLLAATIGNGLTVALDRGDGSWSFSAGSFGKAALFQVLLIVMGVAFGMLLMNSPLALVLYFVLPTGWSILRDLVPRIEKVASWLDANVAMGVLAEGGTHMTGRMWAHLATASAVWVLLPLALGAVRLMRRELK